MKQQKYNKITLDEFDNISLWQLLPAGDGLALKKLKSIVNSILHGQAVRETNKPLSILISGEVGKRTHASAFLRALGIENIRHTIANFLQTSKDVIDYFCGSTPDSGYIIRSLQFLPPTTHKKVYQILEDGQHKSVDPFKMQVEAVPVYGTIVATSQTTESVPQAIKESFDYIVELRTYTQQQKELIALQRLKYANIGIENEGVLKTLILYYPTDLHGLIILLNLSIVVMMAEGRNVLTSEDVRKGKELW